MPISPNPLARRGVIDGAGRRDRTPIPLASERMRVVIRDNLALVSREQTFRNSEERSIEATLTFPVPIHATLHRLVAKIGERTLTGSAMPRAKARHAYEKAVDDGRTAVLHEELVRGIHMLSIAHIPPGSEVKVTHSWISAMSPRGAGKAVLRVPVNLGDVYGDSPFSDADDLSTSPEVIHEADVEIDARAFTASIRGVPVVDSTIRLRLDAPIGVEVNGFSNTPAHGVSADGRSVQVLVVPDRGGDAAIDAAILVDRSGSMGDAASSKQPGLTKHAAIAAGLVDVARALRPTDRAELWQFDNSCERLSDPEEPLIAAVSRLDEPRGGTEIGAALKSVVAGCEARDIVLITDGLSHALDVQTLVNSGHRFTVVLVGEDSLEANVGRLAALSGGQIVLATGGADATAAVGMALASVRRPKPSFDLQTWPLARAAIHAGGAVIEASWEDRPVAPIEPEFGTAVGALAAAIALPLLREDAAIKVAADHRILCHLTSLVLVDEAGTVQTGLPAQRKIPLMAAPQVSFALGRSKMVRCERDRGTLNSRGGDVRTLTAHEHAGRTASSREGDIRTLSKAARQIEWERDPEALRRGDLNALPAGVARVVASARWRPAIVALAEAIHGEVTAIVIALMALSVSSSSRSAERIARAVLAGADDNMLSRAMAVLGLHHAKAGNTARV
ncbi:MAG TPA: VIT domain-containing protein [Stellaceae bacterium]|jgi:hypothetical protein|nr:VIT domain-containing protein [Stellaceae bacterium]